MFGFLLKILWKKISWRNIDETSWQNGSLLKLGDPFTGGHYTIFFPLCVFDIFIHRAFAAPADTYLTKPKTNAPQRQHDMAHQRTGLHRGFLCGAQGLPQLGCKGWLPLQSSPGSPTVLSWHHHKPELLRSWSQEPNTSYSKSGSGV